VLSKIVSGGNRCTSDASSEITRLDTLDSTYRPADHAQVDKIYAQVEPSDLISKGQTTSVYLARILTADENEEGQIVVLKTIEKDKIAESYLAKIFA